eukprot:723021-Pleurochrysis_carterae.AAC.1
MASFSPGHSEASSIDSADWEHMMQMQNPSFDAPVTPGERELLESLMSGDEMPADCFEQQAALKMHSSSEATAAGGSFMSARYTSQKGKYKRGPDKGMR